MRDLSKGQERCDKAANARAQAQQRIDSHKQDPKTTVKADARLQAWGSKFSPQEIAAIYTTPPTVTE